MSQEIREKALSAAVATVGSAGDEAVIAAAKKFEVYILGSASPKAPVATSASAKAMPTSTASASTVSKPTATKPAAGSATTASKPVKAASAPKKPEVDPDTKKMVGDKVNEALRANKRDEIVALLASFDGAQSATGIVMQGDEVIAAFMEGADAILGAAEGSLAD